MNVHTRGEKGSCDEFLNEKMNYWYVMRCNFTDFSRFLLFDVVLERRKPINTSMKLAKTSVQLRNLQDSKV